MDLNLDKIAIELYGKIRARFPNVKIGDESAQVLSKKTDVPKARFFEFQYTENGEPLGTVAIILDDTDGVVIQIIGNITKKSHNAFKFIRSFKQFAKDRLLRFDVQNIEKSNLEKRDYGFFSKSKETTVMENKMYGNAKISFQDLGEAKLIVKHSKPVNTELAAGRTMHIESIYIENIEGERFKYPYKHLNGARALAEHIKAGGNPYDAIGKYITGLSEELSQLRKFKNYVSRSNTLSESMGDINVKVSERIEEIKKHVGQLQKGAYYAQFAESFNEPKNVVVPEPVLNDWIDRLTIRTFNEELKDVFPYIYKIVDESLLPVKQLGPDDFSEVESPKTLSKMYRERSLDYSSASEYFDDQRRLDVAEHYNKLAALCDKISDYYLAAAEADRRGHKDKYELFISHANRLADRLESLTKDDEDDGNYDEEITCEGPGCNMSEGSGYEFNGEPVEYTARYKKNGDGSFSCLVTAKGKKSGNEIDDLRAVYSNKNLQVLGKNIKERFGVTMVPRAETESADPLTMFEALINSIVAESERYNAIFSQNKDEQSAAITDLIEIMKSEIKTGPNGINVSSLKGLIDDPEFIQDLHSNVPEFDVRAEIFDYISKRDPDVAIQVLRGLNLTSADQLKSPEPSPQAAEPTPPEPTPPEPQPENPLTGPSEDELTEGMSNPISEMLQSVMVFWNEEQGNFTIGGTKAKIKLVKEFKQGLFPNATKEDLKVAIQMIEQMDPTSSSDVDELTSLDDYDNREAHLAELVNSFEVSEELNSIAKLAGIKRK